MSLIDEALKRARQEASRQEAAEREKRYARVPVYVPQSRRSRPWLLPVVVTVCLAAGVTGGLLFRSPHSVAPSPANPPAPTPTVAPENTEPKKPIAEKPVIEEQSEPSSPEASAPAPLPTPTPPKPVAEPTPSPVVALPQPAPPSPVVALPQPSPTPAPAPSAPPADIRSYVREVPVGDGTTIRLNGIAFSAQPVALFGDKVVAPGESIGGFTVVAIEAQRVKLQGPGGMVVYVTLK